MSDIDYTSAYSSELIESLLKEQVTLFNKQTEAQFSASKQIFLASQSLKLPEKLPQLATQYVAEFLEKVVLKDPAIVCLLALVSLSIANKVSFSCSKVTQSIQSLALEKFTLEQVVTTERFFIEKLNWKLERKTVCDACEVLITLAFKKLDLELLRLSNSYASHLYLESRCFSALTMGAVCVNCALEKRGSSKEITVWKSFLKNSENLDSSEVKYASLLLESSTQLCELN